MIVLTSHLHDGKGQIYMARGSPSFNLKGFSKFIHPGLLCPATLAASSSMYVVTVVPSRRGQLETVTSSRRQ